jgi:hypothetical protein
VLKDSVNGPKKSMSQGRRQAADNPKRAYAAQEFFGSSILPERRLVWKVKAVAAARSQPCQPLVTNL